MGCPRTSPKACERSGCCAARAQCPKHRQAVPRELETVAPLERDRRIVRCAASALGGSRLVAAARAQAGRHPGCLGLVGRHLRDGSSSRYPGSRAPSLGFSSGGCRRRRDSIRAMGIAPVTVPCNPGRPNQDRRRRRGGQVLLVGPRVEALCEWLERANIKKGPDLPAIYRWEGVDEQALTPKSVNLIVQPRCAMEGVEPEAFLAQGLCRLSDRGGAARNRAARGGATLRAPLGPGGRELHNEAERARQGGKAGAPIGPCRGVAGRQLLRFCLPPVWVEPRIDFTTPHSARSAGLGAESCRPATFLNRSPANPLC
jgi:hypothetical protein